MADPTIPPLDHATFDEQSAAAYASCWQSGTTLETFYGALDAVHLDAAVLADYHGQVCNGGHDQWHLNGYAAASESYVESALRRLRAFVLHRKLPGPDAAGVALLQLGGVRALLRCFQGELAELDEWADDYYQAREDLEASQAVRLDQYDTAFYEVHNWLEYHVNVWLKARLDGEEMPGPGAAPERPPEPPALAPGYRPEEDPRRPRLRLVGTSSNALDVMGAAGRRLRMAGYAPAEIDAYRSSAMSGSYDNLLAVTMRWCAVS